MKIEQSDFLPHLEFFGGKVLEKPVFYNIYLGNYWNSKEGRTELSKLDRFSQQIVKSPYTSTWKEYGGGKGRFIGSTMMNSTKHTITDAEVQAMVKATASKMGNTLDPQTIFTVFLSPKVTLIASDGTSSSDGMGGYHGSVSMPRGKDIYYAAIVHGEKGNGIQFSAHQIDNITVAASHEWSEVVTDPDVARKKLSWYDPNYGEISDIPIAIGLPLRSVFGRINGFAVQKNWSNHDQRAEISRLPNP